MPNHVTFRGRFMRRCLRILDNAHLQVGQAELDLPVQTSRSHQGRVQCVRSVGGHQHLDVASRVEAIELVDELQHSPLDLIVSTSTVIKTSTWQVQDDRRSR